MARTDSIYFLAYTMLIPSIFLTTLSASGQEARFATVPSIRVFGQSKQSVLPDIFTLYLNIQTSGATPEIALAAVAPKIGKLLIEVKKAGIDDRETSSPGPQTEALFRHYFDDKGREISEKREAIGYRATYSLTVTSKKMEMAGALIAIAPEANATVGNLTFDISNRDDLVRKLDVAAATDAIIKARQLIQAVGGKPGRVLEIDPNNNCGAEADLRHFSQIEAAVRDFAYSIRPNPIELSAAHEVTVEILPE